MEPLRHRAAELVEAPNLKGGLDALGDQREPQGFSVADHSSSQLPARIGVAQLRHQRPGDLQDVDRQASKVRERRVPGADVVDGHVDTRPLQGVEGEDRAVEILEHRVLGDLEDQAGGIDVDAGEAPGHPIDERPTAELRRPRR